MMKTMSACSRDLLAGLADDGAGLRPVPAASAARRAENSWWPAAEMARHRAAHDAQADEADVDHVVSSSFVSLSGRRASCARMPAEAFDGRRRAACIRSRSSRVAERVEMAEQEGVVDLAGARLVAAGIVGELHMGDARQVPLHGRGELAFHALHVVDVVLQEQIVRADLVDQLQRLLGAVQEEAGNVEVLIGSISSRMPCLLQRVGGKAQVLDQRLVQLARGRRRRARCRPGSSPAAIERLGVVDGASRRRRGTPPTRSGRQAMPRSPAAQSPAGRLCSTCFRPCSSQLLAQLGLVEVIGEQKLDAVEAGGRAPRRSGRGTAAR